MEQGAHTRRHTNIGKINDDEIHRCHHSISSSHPLKLDLQIESRKYFFEFVEYIDARWATVVRCEIYRSTCHFHFRSQEWLRTSNRSKLIFRFTESCLFEFAGLSHDNFHAEEFAKFHEKWRKFINKMLENGLFKLWFNCANLYVIKCITHYGHELEIVRAKLKPEFGWTNGAASRDEMMIMLMS